MGARHAFVGRVANSIGGPSARLLGNLKTIQQDDCSVILQSTAVWLTYTALTIASKESAVPAISAYLMRTSSGGIGCGLRATRSAALKIMDMINLTSAYRKAV